MPETSNAQCREYAQTYIRGESKKNIFSSFNKMSRWSNDN